MGSMMDLNEYIRKESVAADSLRKISLNKYNIEYRF